MISNATPNSSTLIYKVSHILSDQGDEARNNKHLARGFRFEGFTIKFTAFNERIKTINTSPYGKWDHIYILKSLQPFRKMC